MVDFPGDEALMICGLDAWPFAAEECPLDFKIMEERLQARLKVDHFRLPPDFRIPGPGVMHPSQRIPCVRFPLWHFCPHCGNIRELGLFSGPQPCDGPAFAEGLSCASKPERKRPRVVPLRFVAVCEAGHIRDLPWMEWVHREKPVTAACRLRIRAGRSASLAGIRISCTCSCARTLAGSFDEDALTNLGILCGGQRPWLGDTESDTARCGGPLRVVQRGASNVYFASVVSSIYLPLWGENAERPIVTALEDPAVWSILSQGVVEGKVDPERCKLVATLRRIDAGKLEEAAQRRIDGVPAQSAVDQTTEERYRQAEYQALKAARGGEHVDLFAKPVPAVTYNDPVASHFETVSLVHKLRETRAFVGFSRILPSDGNPREDGIDALRLDRRINWLPAITVRGEGVFLCLEEKRLAGWAGRESVRLRAHRLGSAFNEALLRRGGAAREVSAKFVLLHTLAHLLINQLSFDCGYGSSSLRERIYCDAEDADQPMHGILIYTASGDSEGTMGGLVRQGSPGRFENCLIRALRTARWCSSDPICMESTGQGPDSCNLAACHGCALLPETSCEQGNRLLDRALVVSSPEHPNMGFFGDFTQAF